MPVFFVSLSAQVYAVINPVGCCAQGPSRRPKDGEGVLEGSVAPAGKKTLETLGAADSIAEALEMAANERQRHEVNFLQRAAHPTHFVQRFAGRHQAVVACQALSNCHFSSSIVK